MNFDRIPDPLSLFTGCALWVPLAIWIVALLGWMIVGEIEPLFGLAGITLAFMMGYWGLNPPSPIVPPMLLVLATATIILFPIAQFAMNKASMKEIDVEAVDRAYEVLNMRRDNTGAKLRLARSLFNLGYIGHAVAIADASLKTEDRKIFREEFIMLNSWRNQMHMAKSPEVKPITCIHCGRVNEVTDIFCPQCGGQLLSDYVKGKWSNPGLKAKVLLVWVALAAGLVGFPALGSTLPLGLAIATIAGLAVLLFVFVWFGWRRSEQGAR